MTSRNQIYKHFIEFVRSTYGSSGFIPLHAPQFSELEKSLVLETINSTYVSSVGEFVDRFEKEVAQFTGSTGTIATVNGTSALHAVLFHLGITRGDIVVTQSLTFVATCNAIRLLGAEPAFVDIDRDSLGMSPGSLEQFFLEFADYDDKLGCIHKSTRKKIKAVVPMHTLGHPVDMDQLKKVCSKYQVPVIEDAAESLGSTYKNIHTGTIGDYGILSFNGNKIITTGGGGMILCQNSEESSELKHLTTTAKLPHPYKFVHDRVAFNYRLPNINAALGCAQMVSLPGFIEQKRTLAEKYQELFKGSEFEFMVEPDYGQSNYWLNSVLCPSVGVRDEFLDYSNSNGVMTRPAWELMHRLPFNDSALRTSLSLSEDIGERLICLPSSPIYCRENNA